MEEIYEKELSNILQSKSSKDESKDQLMANIKNLVENLKINRKTLNPKNLDFDPNDLSDLEKKLYNESESYESKISISKPENEEIGKKEKKGFKDFKFFRRFTGFKSDFDNEVKDKCEFVENTWGKKITYEPPSIANSTYQKKIQVNVDTYPQKKDLKYFSEFKRIDIPQSVQAPNLSMDLSIVVQNPGIYPLSSIKSLHEDKFRLKLFENIPPPESIRMDKLDTYMRPHEDPNLKKLMKKYTYKYSSSTSGISEFLTHFFYKLNNFKSPHFYNLSEAYTDEALKFMMFQRKPSSIILHKNDNGSYTINKNNIFEPKIEFILLKMGKYMEKIFTNTPEEFHEKYMIKEKGGTTNEEIVIKEDDYFNFVGFDKILLRSQIDCQGKDKNGNSIVHEIKTRAIAPIRYDVWNYKDYLDYEITSLHGKHSSYEREFYDLIRGAFLKYLFQLKIGGMDGAFISYHNTQKVFGFEYVSLTDMERRILGNSNFSDIIFKASLKLLTEVFDYITNDFPNESKIIVGIYANEWKGTLDIFVELLNEDSYKDKDSINFVEVGDYFYQTGYHTKIIQI